MRSLPWVVAILLAVALGVTVTLLLHPAAPRLPSAPVIVGKVREVALLESLDVTLYRKVSFTPDPPPLGDSAWQAVLQWARYNLRNAHGRAILFADAHLTIDLAKLNAENIRVQGDAVALVLPPVQVQVELRPGETEIIDSNLDSAQTAQLMEAAKGAFQTEVEHDAALQGRARASAQQALRSLLLGLGFRQVEFVASLPTLSPS
jgi:hypothetical protein